MATSLLLLLDDIASTLDDVALMTKVAVKKTAGVLGDDLALNAKQITGAPADRELPVVFKVAIGSLANKGIPANGSNAFPGSRVESNLEKIISPVDTDSDPVSRL